MKELFNVTITLSGKTTNSFLLPEKIPTDEFPEKFVNNYEEKVTTIRNTIDNMPCHQPTHNSSPHNTSFSEFVGVTEDEVRQITTSSPHMSYLLDPIPTYVLLGHLELILPAITDIINVSLKSGIVTDFFKHAIVMLLFFFNLT